MQEFCPRIFSFVKAPAPRLLMRMVLLEELIGRIPGNLSSFVEIGPGLGDLAAFVRARFPEINGTLMEVSERGVALLNRRFSPGGKVSIHHEDFQLVRGLVKFDLAIACEVFEHIEDDDSAFTAVHQLLNPGGYFIFSAPAFMRKWGAADEYAGHYRRYERDALLNKFCAHGFEVTEIYSYGFPLINVLGFFTAIYYRKRIAADTLSRFEATKRSGTDRSLVERFANWPVVMLMTPFFVVQALFKHFNVGDGYVVLARKTSNEVT